MMRIPLYYIFTFFLFLPQLFSLPPEYSSRGTRPYLVNYGAIKGNNFLCKIAQQRFEFLDEAQQKEINYIRRIDPDYLILKYKDIVAAHIRYQEYRKVNLYESAFLHTSDPANLTLMFDKNWIVEFSPDDRFKTTNEDHQIRYKLYFSTDSLTFQYIDSTFNSTKIKVDLPKSAKFLKVHTVADDTIELEYSFVVQLFYDSSLPLVFLREKSLKRSGNFDTINIKLDIINNIFPDSLTLFIDLDKDNKFTSIGEQITRKGINDHIDFQFTSPNNSYTGGYEFYVLIFKYGKSFRFPKEGYWTTNTNNRTKNPTYGFFVMNVGDSNWRAIYIDEVKKSFPIGYNGIFVDDCWFSIQSWGIDAIPPYSYSDEKWKKDIIAFLTLLRDSIGNVPIFINGLYAPEADTLLTSPIDGAMTEGFASQHWSANLVSTPYWQVLCNLGLQCQHKHKKKWLALGGIRNQQPKARLYCLGSYLLVFDSLSYFANATSYQDFAYYPEFDIPLGKPLQTAIDNIDELKNYDINNKPYYKREFENFIVYVNPSNKDTISIPEIDNRQIIILVDTNKIIDGGRLTTTNGNRFLFPNEAKIILKTKLNQERLTSPIIKNPKAIAEQENDDFIRLTFTAEIADSSSKNFFSNTQFPLYVVADVSNLFTKDYIILNNYGDTSRINFSEYKGSIIMPSGMVLHNQTIPILAFSPTGLFTVSYTTIEAKNLDTSNLIQNFSFEYDTDEDGIPDFWRKYQQGFILDSTSAFHGKRSIMLENLSLDDKHGIYYVVNLNQTEPKKLKISGYSKAENVDGSQDNDYSIYVDFYYTDGSPLWGQTAKFSVGTHDWEYSEKIVVPEKPLAKANLYCLFRNHRGKVWFDKIALEEYKETSFSELNANNEAYIKIIGNIIENGTVKIFSPKENKCRIYFYNLLGKLLGNTEITLTEGVNQLKFEELTEKLPNGCYIMQLENAVEKRELILSKLLFKLF